MSKRIWIFSVQGVPKGQPRGRAFARKVTDSATGVSSFKARVFDSGTAEGWKSQIAISLERAGLLGRRFQGAIRLGMACHFARPKAHYRTGKNAALLRDSAPFHHTSKPDLDNIEKAVKDAMTQCGVWGDDAQVAQVNKSKCYAAAGAPATTTFTIQLLGEVET